MALFNNIPGNIRPPFMYAEFQSAGTPYQNNARLLLVGQITSAGAATPNHPVQVRDGDEARLSGHQGAMLARMHRIARRNAPLQEIWWLPLADDGSGVAATGQIDVDATLSSPNTLQIYIAGERVRIAVLASDTDANIATKLTAAINAVTDCPLTAAVDVSTDTQINLTARHKGTVGNSILIDTGRVEDENGVADTLLTITAMSGGSGDPDLTTALGNLADAEYDWICGPYSDTNSLSDVKDYMNDTSGRWSYVSQQYGHYIGSIADTVGNLTTAGNAQNSAHVTLFPCHKFRSTRDQVAAAVGAIAAKHLQDAPELSRPLQTLEMIGIKGPLLASDTLKQVDRQTLYFDGISGYTVARDGSVRIDRVVTTYQQNAHGDPDWTYLDIETMAQSMYGIRYIRTKLTSVHGRKALAHSNPAGLDTIVTPEDVRETFIQAYAELVADGVFEGVERFAADLVVEIDNTDPNRINASLPLDHVNQLRILAVAAVNYLQRESLDLAA